MRDWNVPKPAPGHGALDIDWSAPEPVRSRTRPDRIETPWGEIWMRTTDGLYRSPAGASLSYGALDDRIDRFHGRWATLRAGVHYRIHGARLAVLRRNADHTTYRSGHCAATGQPGGLWLVEQSTVGRARWEIENWWMTGPRPAPVALTLDQIVERIDPRR